MVDCYYVVVLVVDTAVGVADVVVAVVDETPTISIHAMSHNIAHSIQLLLLQLLTHHL